MSDKNGPWYERSEFEGAGRFSDGVLRQAGAFARVPPNVVTIIGGLLALPMIVAFLRGYIAWGAILFAISSLTDWLDGALARYQQRLHTAGRLDLRSHRTESLRLGPTEFGKKIDPFVDKIRYFAALLPLGWGVFPHAIIWLAIAFAFMLTFGRLLVEWRWGLKPGANAWGKFKVYGEILSITLLVFLAAGMALEMPALVVFSAATALGGVSFMTQTYSVLRQRKTRTS
ncbi:MAG: CDP-alcohol phosphatidyltransferase family protein [Patescibacteria group bacterium]|jgi:phosphatidylglycerophosphate synthase